MTQESCMACWKLRSRYCNGNSAIQEKQQAPQIEFRAIKFNLPWAPYRNSESLSLHKETVRDINFWKEFLDMMAENRFNVLSLWSQHPYQLYG